MKIKFNHQDSIFDQEKGLALTHVIAYKESETCEEMFEAGWVPYKDHWYQTQSSRILIGNLPSKKIKQLQNHDIRFGNCKASDFNNMPNDKEVEAYADNYLDFSIDNIQWGRLNFYDNMVLYSLMNKTRTKDSLGLLSYYAAIQHLNGKYKHLYVSDYYEPTFTYKKSLKGFEYWTGYAWIQHGPCPIKDKARETTLRGS